MTTTPCRRCSECVGCEHHWIPIGGLDCDYKCKHCDAKGDSCLECDGDGCDACKESGVVVIAKVPHYEEICRTLSRVPVTWLGGLLAVLVERLLEAKFFASPDDLRKYVDAIIKRSEP